MPFRISRSSTLGAACTVSFLMLGSYLSFLFIYMLYLQNVLHSSPLGASLTILPAAIAAIPVSQFVAPWFMNRLGTRLTAGLGMLGLLSGIILFLRTGVSSDYVGIILPATLLTMPCGMALCLPTLAVAAVSGVKQTAGNVGTSRWGTLPGAHGSGGHRLDALSTGYCTGFSSIGGGSTHRFARRTAGYSGRRRSGSPYCIR